MTLQLLSHNSCEDRFSKWNEIICGTLLLAEVWSKTAQFLKLIQYLNQSTDIIVLQSTKWQVDKVESVDGAVAHLVDKLELNEQHVLFELSFFVRRSARLLFVQFGDSSCLLLM